MSPPMSLGLCVLAAILFAMVEVSSLSLSSADVQSGAGVTATVTLDAIPSPAGVRVRVSSSNPSVATVPATVVITGPLTARTFRVNPVQGSAGCTKISARVSTTTRSAQLFVIPSTSSSVTLGPNATGGAEATFDISTAVVASTCSVITATYQGSAGARKLLKVSTISG